MNRTFFESEAPNPWKNRASVPYPKFSALLFAALLYVVASLEFVFLNNEYYSMLAFGVLCAGTLLLVRMPRATVGLLVMAVIPVMLTRSFAIGTLVLAATVGTGCGVMLITCWRKPWQVLLLPAVAWTVAYAVTRSPTLACYTLLLVPAILLLAFATLTDQRRSAAICCALGGFLLSVIALFVAYLLTAYGELNRDILFSFFEENRAWVTNTLATQRDAAIRAMQEQLGAESASAVEMLRQTLSNENLTNLVAAMYNVLPALIVMGCSIVAFEAQSFLCGIYYTQGMKAVLTPNATSFTMSVVSAVLYLAAFGAMMFVSGGSMASAVIENCYLILTPGLFLVGWASTRAQLRTARGGSRVFIIVLAVFVLLFSGIGAAISLLAFIGAVMILLSHIGVMMIKRMQKRMGDNAPPDFEAWKRNFERNATQNGFRDPADEEDARPADDGEREDEPTEEDAYEARADEPTEENTDPQDPQDPQEPQDPQDPQEPQEPNDRNDRNGGAV